MTHTPGPWELDDENAVFGPAGGAGVHIADVHTGDTSDAYLIAAAPDLLAALKAIIAEVDSSTPAAWRDLPKWNNARAAIAKAEGRS